MMAIAQQAKWELSQGRLESEGCSFMYSLQGSSYMITPYGNRLQLGRDRERMPLLRGRRTAPGSFVVCDPDSTDAAVVGLLIDTGATTHVAGGRWYTRLNLLPGVGISARTVGGRVSASLGRGLLELDLRAGAPPYASPLDYDLNGPSYPGAFVPGRHARARLPAADVGTFCGEPFAYPAVVRDDIGRPLDFDDDPVRDDPSIPGAPGAGVVYCATGARKPLTSVLHPAEKARRPCRFASLKDHAIVAARLGFTDAAVLRATPDFLTGIGELRVPAGYEPLDECTRLAAWRARSLRHRRDGDSQPVVDSFETGERWYMDWTRMFECSHDRNKFGLVFAEAKTWLLRVRFFRDKSALSLVEGITWLLESVRTRLRRSVRELHGDSDTSWTVSGRGRDLNTAAVAECVRGIDPPFSTIRCPPGPKA